MPVKWLGNAPVSAGQFDVAAECRDKTTGFVTHLGFFSIPHSRLIQDGYVSVTHMAPPLERTEGVNPDAVGWVPLTLDEIGQIDLWICERIREVDGIQTRKQYLVHPHEEVVYGTDGTVKYQRFSCAGFVIEGLRQIGVDLVDTEENRLPKTDWNTLLKAYPQLRNANRFLVELGLEGDGPWPVVLCGYVMHSLKRSENEIRREPYRPVPGDRTFV